METKIDFLKWLSLKLYLTNAAMYATVGLSMLLPFLLLQALAMPQLIASFVAFLIISLSRAFFESIVINESPINGLAVSKLLTLSVATAATMTIVIFYLKAPCGNFVIPLAVIISRKIVGALKTALWQNTVRLGYFAELATKLQFNMTGTYYFFGALVGITYFAYGKYGFNFAYIFPSAFFLGIICEELYFMINVYEIEPGINTMFRLMAWAAACAIASTIIVISMMQLLGCSGQVATIVGVILIKLVQPLGSRKLILGL